MSEQDEKNEARVTLYLPPSLLEWVKIQAARERKRPNAIIVGLVERARRAADERAEG